MRTVNRALLLSPMMRITFCEKKVLLQNNSLLIGTMTAKELR